MAPLSNFVPSTFTGAPSDASSTPIDPSSSSSSPAVEEDCISCRIIGGATFAGLGGYAMYESVYQGALKKGGEPKTRVLTLGALGAAMAVLGLGRLAGVRVPGAGGHTKVGEEGRAASTTTSMLPSQIGSAESIKSN